MMQMYNMKQTLSSSLKYSSAYSLSYNNCRMVCGWKTVMDAVRTAVDELVNTIKNISTLSPTAIPSINFHQGTHDQTYDKHFVLAIPNMCLFWTTGVILYVLFMSHQLHAHVHCLLHLNKHLNLNMFMQCKVCFLLIST